MDQLAEILARTGLREELILDAGVSRLGKMIGLASLDRNLEAEDEMVRREYEAEGKFMHEADYEATKADEGDGMKIMAAGNVYFNTEPKPKPTTPPALPPTPPAAASPPPAPVPQPTQQPAAQPAAPAGLTPTQKLAAALLGTTIATGGLGTAIYAGLASQAPDVNITQDPTAYELHLLPPDKP